MWQKRLLKRTEWLILTVVAITGCALSDPVEPSPIAPLLLATEQPSPLPTMSIEREATPLHLATATMITPTPMATPPIATPSPTPETFPTPTALPEIAWAETVSHVGTVQDIDNFTAVWSPVADEFLVSNCWVVWNHRAERETIFRVSIPDLALTEVTPADFVCELFQTTIWTPDGQQIVFAGPFPEDHPHHRQNYGFDNTALWIMNRDGSESRPINYETAYGRYPKFTGWMDERLLVYTFSGGGSYHSVFILDIDSGEPVSWGGVNLGGGYLPGKDYVATNTGMLMDYHISAVAVSMIPLQEETIFDGGPFIVCVSRICGNPPDRPTLLEENSRFEDWLPGTNQMLILTWEREEFLFSRGEDYYPGKLSATPLLVTRLQLWDVDSHLVTPLLPDGIFGRFSPDGHYLAYHTLNPLPQLHVLNIEADETIFSHSSAEPHFGIHGEMFVWSPTSRQLVLRDSEGNWGIVSLYDDSFTPLTGSGGGRLFDPQWSYDGRYLSFAVQGGGVVILAVGESE